MLNNDLADFLRLLEEAEELWRRYRHSGSTEDESQLIQAKQKLAHFLRLPRWVSATILAPVPPRYFVGSVFHKLQAVNRTERVVCGPPKDNRFARLDGSSWSAEASPVSDTTTLVPIAENLDNSIRLEQHEEDNSWVIVNIPSDLNREAWSDVDEREEIDIFLNSGDALEKDWLRTLVFARWPTAIVNYGNQQQRWPMIGSRRIVSDQENSMQARMLAAVRHEFDANIIRLPLPPLVDFLNDAGEIEIPVFFGSKRLAHGFVRTMTQEKSAGESPATKLFINSVLMWNRTRELLDYDYAGYRDQITFDCCPLVLTACHRTRGTELEDRLVASEWDTEFASSLTYELQSIKGGRWQMQCADTDIKPSDVRVEYLGSHLWGERAFQPDSTPVHSQKDGLYCSIIARCNEPTTELSSLLRFGADDWTSISDDQALTRIDILKSIAQLAPKPISDITAHDQYGLPVVRYESFIRGKHAGAAQIFTTLFVMCHEGSDLLAATTFVERLRHELQMRCWVGTLFDRIELVFASDWTIPTETEMGLAGLEPSH